MRIYTSVDEAITLLMARVQDLKRQSDALVLLASFKDNSETMEKQRKDGREKLQSLMAEVFDLAYDINGEVNPDE